jgi:large subunit ribosomal protein L18
VIDDSKGETLVTASSAEKDLRSKLKSGSNKDAAVQVGKILAQRAGQKKITQVVFDRNGFGYHGRIRALADSAREAGLKF